MDKILYFPSLVTISELPADGPSGDHPVRVGYNILLEVYP